MTEQKRRCGCEECAPDMFPTGPRRHSDHIALRFNDMNDPRFQRLLVILDGHPLFGIFEACAGADGFVVGYHSFDLDGTNRTTHPCLCGSGKMCMFVAHGYVELREEI